MPILRRCVTTSLFLKVAREQDTSQAHAKFHLAQAEVDIDKAKGRRAAVDKSKAKAAERQAMLEELEPVLSLKHLQDEGSDSYTVKWIQLQIAWHQTIGQDVHIPIGIHKKKKAEAWVVMVWAVRRHLHGTSTAKGDTPTVKYWHCDANRRHQLTQRSSSTTQISLVRSG